MSERTRYTEPFLNRLALLLIGLRLFDIIELDWCWVLAPIWIQALLICIGVAMMTFIRAVDLWEHYTK